MYICIYIYIYTYIYIYIERDRERERERFIYLSIYLCIQREREREMLALSAPRRRVTAWPKRATYEARNAREGCADRVAAAAVREAHAK